MERLGIRDFYVFAGWRLFLEVGISLAQAEELVLLGVGLGATLLGQEAVGRSDSAWQMSAIQNEKSVHSAFRYNSTSPFQSRLCLRVQVEEVFLLLFEDGDKARH